MKSDQVALPPDAGLEKTLLICERAALSVNCSSFLSASFSKNVKIDAPENPPTS
jgi:hypothetical protein